MGPYSSVGAHIQTGKRSMAPDHFQTTPDPKKAINDTSVDPKQQYISRLSKTRMYKTLVLPQTLAPVPSPSVHALRCTWVSGACTCSRQGSVVSYSLWSTPSDA